MATIAEMKAARQEAVETMKTLNGKAKAENRSFTDQENSEYKTAKDSLEQLCRDIELAEIENRSAQPPMGGVQKPTAGNQEGISVRSLINEVVAGRVASAEIPVENRAMTVTGTDAGTVGTIVDTNLRPIIDELEESLVISGLGVDFQGGLVGMQSQPIMGNATAHFLGENDELTADDLGLNKDDLRPHRLAVLVEISDQLLLQDSQGAESKIRTKLVNAIARGLEKKIFSKDAATSKIPGGLLSHLTSISKGAVADFKKIVKLEGALDSNNALAGNMAYITNAVGRAELKTTARTNEHFLLENNQMNDYKTIRTNFLKSDFGTGKNEYPVVFGDWSSLQVCQWGALKITLDPYTKAASNKVRLIVQTYMDFAPKYVKSFAYSTFTVAQE